MQADLQRGHVPVNLDRERVLIFDDRATWELMQAFGPAFMHELYEKDERGLRVRSLEALEGFLLIGLRRESEDAGELLTAAEVKSFIRPLTINMIFSTLLRALSWTPGDPKNAHAAAESHPAAAK